MQWRGPSFNGSTSEKGFAGESGDTPIRGDFSNRLIVVICHKNDALGVYCDGCRPRESRRRTCSIHRARPSCIPSEDAPKALSGG